MAREFTVIIERDEDGHLVGSVPALRGCHTQARTSCLSGDDVIRLCLDEAGVEPREV